MGKISVLESVTLDGVMQAPGHPDEDTRGSFGHGGWGPAYADHVACQFLGEGMANVAAMLFGRRTYEGVLDYWTTTPDPNPFTDVLVNAQKFVASRSEDTVLKYPNSTLLPGEATATVAELRRQTDGNIFVMGSGSLVRSLHAAGLLDEYVLLIHPIVLGTGQPLFGPGDRSDLVLERSVATTTGVIIAQYSCTQDWAAGSPAPVTPPAATWNEAWQR